MIFQIAKKHQKLSSAVLLAVFVLVVFGGVLAPVFQVKAEEKAVKAPVEAGFFTEPLFGALKLMFEWISYGTFYVAGMILAFELDILEQVVNSLKWDSKSILPAVTLGWGIVRDTANLFFIVVIMIIAFATVLQLETYGMKALLPKLIAIALLINFSLVICGFLINLSDSLAGEFTKMSGGGVGLKIAMSKGLGIERFIADKGVTPAETTALEKGVAEKAEWLSNKDPLQKFLTMLLTTGMAIISSLIAIFVIGAGIFFVAIRQISLIYIVILSPMALICLLLPFLNSYWSQWKEAFTKWAIFYPIYMFFVFLAIQMISTPLWSDNMVSKPEGLSGIASPATFWKLVIASMFLCGAIIVAQKTGVAGASAIGSFGKSALTALPKMAGRRLKEEGKLRGAQVRARLAPTALGRAEGKRATEAILKQRQERLEKAAGVTYDDKGNVTGVKDRALLEKTSNRTIGGKDKYAASRILKSIGATRTKLAGELKEKRNNMRGFKNEYNTAKSGNAPQEELIALQSELKKARNEMQTALKSAKKAKSWK